MFLSSKNNSTQGMNPFPFISIYTYLSFLPSDLYIIGVFVYLVDTNVNDIGTNGNIAYNISPSNATLDSY